MTELIDDPNHVPIPVGNQLAQLALAIADGLKKLPPTEFAKLQTLMRAEVRPSKVTANKLTKLCSLVGFMFAMDLSAARDKRIAEMGVTNEVPV